MTVFSFLYTLLIQPLQLLFELIYSVAYNFVESPGLTIIALSLAMNLLVLPLYRRADAMQAEQRDLENRLSLGVQHIKRTFRGDEQMMMLQTYYRQNNYKPAYVLRSATSLLLEIPFFIAAYRFLSNLALLNGAGFGPIVDLGRPDGLLVIAGRHVNLLPILMTAINFVSSWLFSRDYPVRTKVQLYGMALFFLVFLYRSPSGLVFYWTLNNLFSLVKTIFYKLRHPKEILRILTGLSGCGFSYYAFFVYPYRNIKVYLVFGIVGLILQLPWLILLFRRLRPGGIESATPVAANPRLFLASAVLLTFLTGLLIPSSVIRSSPLEFVIPGVWNHPSLYLLSSFGLAAGTFLVWFGVFYWLSSPKGRQLFERVMVVLCGVALLNYLFFGRDLGTISTALQFDRGLFFSGKQQLLNLALVGLLALFLWLPVRRHGNLARSTISIFSTVALIMTAVNVLGIRSELQDVNPDKTSYDDSLFTLSRDGQNVIVIMLDRALGEFVPTILEEKPELLTQFDGFTYYPNTVSYGTSTSFGSPGLYGGYDYIPSEMNLRADESLANKHDEALLVLPLLFSEEGYQVITCDPPYARYVISSDLSLFDGIPNVRATTLYRTNFESSADLIRSNQRNFFCYSVVKVTPLFLQRFLYSNGTYRNPNTVTFSSQDVTDLSHAIGRNIKSEDAIRALCSLPDLVNTVDGTPGTLLFMVSDVTHEPALLQTPDYVPSAQVDNEQYDLEHTDRVLLQNTLQMRHYHVNMAAFLQLGVFFDHLRELGIYDNTRIILVSDHGYPIAAMPDHQVPGCEKRSGNEVDIEAFLPLLMVKDFSSTGFTVSEELMTNADVPALSLQGLIDDPVNPFTGNPINSNRKLAGPLTVFASSKSNIQENHGNTFLPGDWYTVHDDVRVAANWSLAAQNSTLP